MLVTIFTTSVMAGLLVTFIVRKLAIHYKIGEYPDYRKVHKAFMPHLGGLGILSGFITGLGVFFLLRPFEVVPLLSEFWPLLTAAIITVLLGVWDDLKGLNAPQKFGGQFLAVTLVVFWGWRIEAVYIPFVDIIHLGWLSIPITYLWLIGVNNAVNLLDGLDGLAGGVSFIAGTVFFLFAWQNGDLLTAVIILSLLGGILGFLRFNYHPASIFMGDTGSLFLGLMLAVLSLRIFQYSAGSIALAVPIIALAIPIGDTSVAFFRRLNSGRHPFKPDRDHLHHRLIFLGLSHLQAVHIIYLAAFIYGLTAYLMAIQSPFYGVLLLILVLILSFFGLKRMGYLEAKRTRTIYGDEMIIEVQEGIAPLSIKRMWHKIILAVSDIICINAALVFIWWLRFKSEYLPSERIVAFDDLLFTPVPLILSLFWVGLFVMHNLYAMRWDVSRFDQVRRVVKVIVLGVLILFIFTQILQPGQVFSEGRINLLLYGVSMIVLVSFGRLLVIMIEKWFAILEYAPHKTLLVGASNKGRKLLKDIYNNQHLLYDIVGYVTKGKSEKPFYDLKPLGDYEDIPDLIKRFNIEEIIIAINQHSRDEVLSIVSKAESSSVIFKIIPQIYDAVTGHKTEEVIGHPLIRLFPDRMYLWQWILKRIFDVLLALCLFVILSPLAILIIAGQIISGIYPPLQITNVVGRYGRIFGMLNFALYPPGKTKMNAMGKFLYFTRLYKFPELVNIIMGKMSFVGPRSETVETVKILREKIKFFNRRFQIRPGFTGWAQVKYRYETALKHKREQFKHDLFYLENMSLSFDLRILMRSLILFILRR
ncbi:MAG: hypothetical protein GF313_14125 [Caldithrix sp.]|nr:hypothetical protein [Caldithrix sp.]